MPQPGARLRKFKPVFVTLYRVCHESSYWQRHDCYTAAGEGLPKKGADGEAFSSLPAGLDNCCPGIACLGLSLEVLQKLVVVSKNMIPCQKVQEAVVKVTHNLVLRRLAAVRHPAESRSGGKSCRLQKVSASTLLRPDTRAVVCCVKSSPFTWHELA